ncbi:MAG TPA: GNAT family N-acetyltransferase [Vicinamibacterales bacterium]|nr:GNAT family N-acetyltransferase [Vicinamibacterales bacterium]
MSNALETDRLVLIRPSGADADAIFSRYAADPEVTRYVGWPLHRTLDDTRAFLQYSDREWAQWPAGPYLVLAKDTRQLLGGTGYAFETSYRAMTGYVLARDAWGRGYATEALAAIVARAPALGLRRLFAYCHVDHRPSWRVLEKGGFVREGILRRAFEFPNLAPGEPQDVLLYARVF